MECKEDKTENNNERKIRATLKGRKRLRNKNIKSKKKKFFKNIMPGMKNINTMELS